MVGSADAWSAWRLMTPDEVPRNPPKSPELAVTRATSKSQPSSLASASASDMW